MLAAPVVVLVGALYFYLTGGGGSAGIIRSRATDRTAFAMTAPG